MVHISVCNNREEWYQVFINVMARIHNIGKCIRLIAREVVVRVCVKPFFIETINIAVVQIKYRIIAGYWDSKHCASYIDVHPVVEFSDSI